MGVIIKSIHRMEGYADRHFAAITHCGHALDVVLCGQYEQLLTLIHLEITAEYELNEVIAINTELAGDDSLSGIYPLEEKQIAVDGTIHNECEIDDSVSLLDIYIQNGADFLAISTDELGIKPEVGTRIRIIGKGLRVYPNFTQAFYGHDEAM